MTPPCGVPQLLSLPCHASRPITVPLLDRSLEPHLDKTQDVPIDDAPSHTLHQLGMRNGVEVLGQIGIHHIGVALAEQFVHRLDRVGRRPTRSIAVSIGLEVRLEDRFDHELHSGLHHPVPNGRDAERPLAAAGLRDQHPPNRLGSVGSALQLRA
jgi:hypothetical protein